LIYPISVQIGTPSGLHGLKEADTEQCVGKKAHDDGGYSRKKKTKKEKGDRGKRGREKGKK
jgi:hypothetical protein